MVLILVLSRGPRRTISTACSRTNHNRRVMLWTGNIDEIHDIERHLVRSVAGGMGEILWTYPLGKPSNDFRDPFRW